MERRRLSFLGLVIMAAPLSVGCHRTPASPSTGAVVTLRVADEVFRIWLGDTGTIEAARRAQAGGPARIPSGRIVAGTQVNTGWSWHLEEVSFAEATIELCDGRPSDVERRSTTFGGGRYCPWQARVIQIDGRP
jgi:hypothetical protein